MATIVTEQKMRNMIRNLDAQWKKDLVYDLYFSWQEKALIETTSQIFLRFKPKKGGKFFAILFPYKSGKLKLSISDYREIIHLSSLPLTKTGEKQFEKSKYGERIVFIESEKQCDSVKEAFEIAFRLKIKEFYKH